MRKFLESDYETLVEWFKARNQPAPAKEILPPCGFIEEGVGAGFLIKTDCKFAILDFFVTNPHAQREERLKTLETIAVALTRDAKASGLKFVRCDTRFENIKRLAGQLNFHYFGELSLFAKEL